MTLTPEQRQRNVARVRGLVPRLEQMEKQLLVAQTGVVALLADVRAARDTLLEIFGTAEDGDDGGE